MTGYLSIVFGMHWSLRVRAIPTAPTNVTFTVGFKSLGQIKLICCCSDSPVVFLETGKNLIFGVKGHTRPRPSHVKPENELLCVCAVPRACISSLS